MAALPETGARAVPAWRQKLSAFWRWWTGELAHLVPERFAALGGAGRVPQLAIEGDEVVLLEPRPASGAEARVATTQDPARARTALRALLERVGETRMRARLVLADHEALVRRATMPAATEENLAQVLAFEMDRLTPFRADDVYHDHRVVSRDAAAGTLQVLIAVARRDLVDARVAALRALGVTVEGVNPRQDLGAGAGALNLMPSELRGERETPRERLLKRALLAVVGLLLFAVLVYPPWAKREVIKSLHPVEAKAQADAQGTSRLANELERLVAEYNFLLTKKHAQAPALAYIEELSRLLPDNTWVQQLELKAAGKSRELQIQGETVSSSKLIEILSQSTMLKDVSTRGTVTRGSQPGTERFYIVAEARPRALPEATALSQIATPVASGPAAGTAPPAPAAPAAAPKAEAAKVDPAKIPAKVEPVAPPKAPADPKAGKAAPGK